MRLLRLAILALASLAAVLPARAGTHVIAGQTFRGVATRECLEIVGGTNVVVRDCEFFGGSCQLRFVDCRNVSVLRCTFHGAAGTPDPDGQDVQLIRSTGSICGNAFYASGRSEDLVSVYADRATPGAVTVAGNWFYGRGVSASSTSICIDGPCPPPTLIQGNRILDARCGVCLAGGTGHVVISNTFVRCETPWYVHAFYGGRVGFVIGGNR